MDIDFVESFIELLCAVGEGTRLERFEFKESVDVS
jgi:hypothetical protein